MVILYLETNFLMSLALNQDPDASALLEKAAQDRSLRLAIPQVCIMEAFATIRKRVEERATFQRRIETEINQLERSKTSPVARQLLDELNQSLITNDEYTNRILDDFQQATDRLASLGEMFPVGRDSLMKSFADPLIKSKRERLVLPDNFIICNIIENASVTSFRGQSLSQWKPQRFWSTGSSKGAQGSRNREILRRGEEFSWLVRVTAELKRCLAPISRRHELTITVFDVS